MERKDLEEYDARPDGYYCRGKRITNFICQLKGVIVDIRSGQRIFRILIIVEKRLEVTVEIPAQSINSGSWLVNLPVPAWCDDPKEFSKVFRKVLAFSEEEDNWIERVSSRTGFQKVDGKWCFLFSNGALTVDGFNRKLYSTVKDGVYCGEANWIDEDDTVIYLNLIRQQADSIYPILAINLLSLGRDLFQAFGLDLGMSLWLEGKSGSGKTTLAQVFGTFVESLEDQGNNCNAWHRRRVLSATEKISVVVDTLQRSHGLTVVVDDFKKEKAQRQREKTGTVLDIVIRSVYKGYTTEQSSKNQKLEETTVGTCAILTGEYRETEESQNARMIIVDVTEFMQDQKKRAMITAIQTHSWWQTNLLGSFVRWLIWKAEEDGIGEKWRKKMEDLQNATWIYEDRSNGQRLKDSRSRLCFITDIFGEFLAEQFPGQREVIGRFLRAAKESIEKSIIYTFENLGGIKAIADSIMKEFIEGLIKDNGIRSAAYNQSSYLGNRMDSRWDEEQFCFADEIERGRKEQALLIPELRKSFQNTEYQGQSVDEAPCLIMLRKDFEARIQQIVNQRIQEGSIFKEERERIALPLLARLGFLIVWPRYDGVARYHKPYPVVTFWKQESESSYFEEDCDYGLPLSRDHYSGELRLEPAVCFDLRNELLRGILQETYPEADIPRFMPREEVKEASRTRRAFLNGMMRLK